MNAQTDILKPEHRAMGLSLKEDDHLIYLKDKDGKTLAYWLTSGTNEAEIQSEADLHLKWENLKSKLEAE